MSAHDKDWFTHFMKPSRRVTKLLLLGFAGLMGLALLLVVVERLRGVISLNTRIRSLEEAGEKMTVRELLPPPTPADANAFSAILSLSNKLTLGQTNFGWEPSSGQWTTNGTMVPATRVASWKGGDVEYTWDAIQVILQTKAPTVAAVEAAVGLPGWDEGVDFSKGFRDFFLPNLIEGKWAGVILKTASLAALQRGDHAEAFHHLKALLRLITLQGESRLMIQQMVRSANGSMAWNVTWEGLALGAWTPEQLAELNRLWSGINYLADMARACEMERAMTLDDFEHFGRSRQEVLKQLEQQWAVAEMWDAEALIPMGKFFTKCMHVTLWQAAWRHQDQLRALNLWQNFIEVGRETERTSWMAATNRLAELGGPDESLFWMPSEPELRPSIYNRFRYLLSNNASSLNTALAIRPHKTDGMRTLVVTAIALEQFKAAESRYPDQLSELVPRFLSAVPIDFADGRPLRYRREGESFQLYSIGPNFVDDGGESKPAVPQEQRDDFWAGLDAVWPKPARAEEISAMKFD